MSEPIKVGDLVVIVHPAPCGCHEAAGGIFRVERIRTQFGCCTTCGCVFDDAVVALGHRLLPTHVSRLKRVPPLDELDDVKKDEEITA